MGALTRSLFVGMALLGVVFAGTAFVGVRGAEADPGTRFAALLSSVVNSLEETSYQHRTEIDEESGSYKCDCSGMLVYFLRKEFPDSFASLRGEEAPWASRPLAVTFYETFVRAGREPVKGWERVTKLMEARPGDILAWRRVELRQGEITGHVLMIASVPEIEPDGRIRVRVVDSTRRIHAEDTRAPGTDGVGAGTMWFEVNTTGEVIRYFVDGESVAGTELPIALGRLAENPK